MKDKIVKVNDAISKGIIMINYPSMGIFFITFFTSVYSFATQDSIFYPLLFLIASIILPWVYWSFTIVHWRVWAFSKVRNVHELKRKAISNKLIWPDDSIFNRTEFRTKRQQQVLAKLELKFQQQDTYEYIKDDGTYHEELIIYRSKTAKYLDLSLAIIIILGGLYLFTLHKFFWAIMAIVFGFFWGQKITKTNLKDPQIIINHMGIRIKNLSVIAWRNFRYIEFEKYIDNNNQSWRLIIKMEGDQEYVHETILSDLNISNTKLEEVVKIYHQRYLIKTNKISPPQ